MKNRKEKKDKLPALFEQMEPRLLFSADVEGTHAADQQPSPTDAYQQTVLQQSLDSDREATRETPAAEVRIELIFVDTDTPEYQTLLSDLLTYPDDATSYQLFELDNTQDGIAQISEALAEHEDLSAVHVVSHGSEGAVRLGSRWLNAENLGTHEAELAGWSDALGLQADLLFYGCDLAKNDAGVGLLDSLAELIGVDVAASTDLTPVYYHAIGRSLCIYAECLQSVCHDLDTVTLLDAQPFGTGEQRAALCTGGGDKNHRKFIDGQWHQFRRNIDTAQPC